MIFQTFPLPEPAGSILLTSGLDVRLHPSGSAPSRSELEAGVRDAEGLLCLLADRIDDELMAGAPRLRVISNYAVGHDNIDVEAATRRGILVTNTPGILDETTADLAFALLLATARRVVEADGVMRRGEFTGWTPDFMLGLDVHHRTLGIIGMGRIGQRMARRSAGFSMRVLYAQPRRLEPALETELNAQHVALEDVLRLSDFVSLHAPLRDETRHMIGTPELALMRPQAILINTARGALVDEAALVDALNRRRIAGAGLDVFEHEPRVHPGLAANPAVVMLPHVGSATLATRARMAQVAANNLVEAMEGRPPAHPVNPDVLSR